MIHMKRYPLFLLTVLLYSLRCTVNVSGTISETDSGCAVAGSIKDNEGKTVQGAMVIMHDIRNTTAAGYLPVQSLKRADTTVTDDNGHFLFASVDTGDFLIEVIYLDSLGTIISVTVQHADTLIETQSIVKPSGTITGTIDTVIADIPGKKSVLVRELGKVSDLDSNGSFIIPHLPEWQYHLSIIRDSKIDTGAGTMVQVRSGKTSRIICLGSIIARIAEDSSITINTDSALGGAIAFLQKDSTLKLRLLAGGKSQHSRIDIAISQFKPDTANTVSSNLFQKLSNTNTSFSIMNDNNMLYNYNIVKNESSLSFNVSPDTSTISGDIVITGISDNLSYTSVKIWGSFTAEIGPEEDGSWDCDYGDTISTCWFLH